MGLPHKHLFTAEFYDMTSTMLNICEISEAMSYESKLELFQVVKLTPNRRLAISWMIEVCWRLKVIILHAFESIYDDLIVVSAGCFASPNDS